MTSVGHARAIFKRAIERANLVVAEVTAGEIGRIGLIEALELTALVAQRDSEAAPSKWYRIRLSRQSPHMRCLLSGPGRRA
jgi:hypothetical protein